MPGETHHDHRATADTQRDVLALSRALLQGDAEAVNTVLDHTGCHGCLSVAAMQWGFSLASWAGGDTAATSGRPVGTPEFRRALEQVIADAQRQLAGMTSS